MVITLVDYDQIRDAVTEALENGKGRNFTQSVELAINLKDLDLSDPKKRVDADVMLPHGRGRAMRVGLFCSGEMATKSKGIADVVVTPEEIEDLADDKAKAKQLVNETSFFLAEAPLMPTIGRTLGVVLGPRGKMPSPIPPGSDPAPQIANLKKTVRVRSKDKTTFHVAVGSEDQGVEHITENIKAVMDRLRQRLERGDNNLRSVYVKTTMGPSIKIL